MSRDLERDLRAAAAEASAGAQDGRLESAMRDFASISQDLVEGYQALATRAKRVEEELCQANAKLAAKVRELDSMSRDLEAILEALPTGVVVRDAEGAIVRINGAAMRTLDALPPDETREGASALPREVGVEEVRELRRQDGSDLVVSVRSSTIHGADQLPSGTVQILDDRTELHALSDRLHTLDKAAALGTMAGGIAHEIRNPLNAVQGFAALLLREAEGEGDQRQSHWAKCIVDGASEADQIITNLLSLADPERVAWERVDAEELLEAALRAAALPEGDTRWEVTLSADAPPFQADRIKLRQAIRNLIANAVDAQPEGGAVHVSLSLRSGEVVVAVADAGDGVPPAARGRIADPFFTTRAEGTGLGLALTQAIARLHGGALFVSPEPSPLGGADIRIRFPFTPAH